ncbi:GrpB family protein [Providencia huaxiensis]|uniref:GrpB family protein n=1 Tax=Providencia huaxiensis TaxID=2027290 RepID=UPI0034DD00D1
MGTRKTQTEIIDVVDYDPNWQAQFKQIKQNIQNKLGHKALAIEHVGSTAVSDLSAKPVIDIDLLSKFGRNLIMLHIRRVWFFTNCKRTFVVPTSHVSP